MVQPGSAGFSRVQLGSAGFSRVQPGSAGFSRAQLGLTYINYGHIGNKCGKVPLKTYKELTVKDHFQWTCPRCIHEIYDNPMPDIGDIDLDNSAAFEELKTKIGNRGVKIAHINVNGLLSKLPQIELLLLECNLDVLAITETHLSSKTKDHEIAIINYDIERFYREEKQDKGGGGCLIYFKQSPTVFPRSSRLNIVKETESAWIELTVKSQKFLVGAVYRPPDDEEFFANFSSVLTSIKHKRKNIILLGDFNSDLLEKGSSKALPGNRMKRIIKCFDLKNIIKEPTRVSRTAKTLIDLIIVSDPDKIERSGSIEPAISDHKLIYCVLQIKNVSSKPVIKEARTKRAFGEKLI